MKEYVYETSCVHCADRVDALNKMTEDAKDVTYRTMCKHCKGLLEWAINSGYNRRKDQGITLRNDWHVSYHKSNFDGLPCYYLRWSGIEFIWTKGSRCQLHPVPIQLSFRVPVTIHQSKGGASNG